MIHQSISKSPISFSVPVKIRCESKIGTVKPPAKPQMGPYTGRDPNAKKPEWLRQKAPQGQKFQEVKESLSSLKLNTVCEEAQCPNIGEVRIFSTIFFTVFVFVFVVFNL